MGEKPKHISRRKAAAIRREAKNNYSAFMLKKIKLLNKLGLTKDKEGNVITITEASSGASTRVSSVVYLGLTMD